MGQAAIKRARKSEHSPSDHRRISARDRRRQEHLRRARNAVIGVVVGAAVVTMFWATSRRSPEAAGTLKAGSKAPAFSLPSTDGGTVTLASLAGHNSLFYFNEGVGCDPCFTQMVELKRAQAQLDNLGVTLHPVMANSASSITKEMRRFGLSYPVLIDESTSVSGAYGTLGTGHHASLPGHSFVLVDKTGTVRWRGDYPGMYVSANELIKDLQHALGA